ncbi:major facilitator superfamily protein [Trichomonas vaginalis G3]|uniref:Major facilitator superfamily protein n=1 Tax=Trichomonas vaginalis (strain ATCC PRA-98 / G3) TaxID=412133 RepID=A2ENU9_TRIV3|nr:major facilitator superfamily transporter [Trichomonas vaginalis G3]EAY05639.1 major facilitator superfamily protein [Trichomonas vaginalis G3]KAI5553879.1 glucose import [Trichomonas vaginalis G3]|eukprot:XP_001317862.1 major facilitator superfamily transporter [Trichomonas vaginalis G3]
MGLFRKELLYAVIIQFTSFSFGFILAIASPAADWYKENWNISDTLITYYQSLPSATAIAGTYVLAALFHFFGRNMTTTIVNIFTILTWVMLLFVTKTTFWLALVARVMQGISMGVSSALAPLHLSEIAPEDSKGFYASINTASITLAIIIFFCCAEFLKPNELNYIAIAVHALQTFTIWFVPETKPKEEKHEDQTVKESICQPQYIKLVCVAISIMFIQQFSGPNAITVNFFQVLKKAKLSIKEGFAASIIMTTQILSTIFLSGYVDKFGRKILWIISCMSVGITLGLFGLSLQLNWNPFIGIVDLCIFQIAFGLGLGPMPWYLGPQMLPPQFGGTIASICTSTNWLFSFAIIQLYSPMEKFIKTCGCFYFFAGIAIVGGIYGYFFIKDNKDSSKYEEI